MIRSLFIWLICSLPLLTQAQIAFENRLELELRDGYFNEKIFEFGSDGFILRASARDPEQEGMTTWKFDRYNTDLELERTVTINVPKAMRLDETYTDDSRIYTLYKSRKGDFEIVTVDTRTMEVTRTEGLVPKKSYIKEMAILGDLAFFSASVKLAPFLFSVNLKTGERKLIPVTIRGIKPKKISLMNFQLLEETEEVLAYALVKTDKREYQTYVIQLDKAGNQGQFYNLTADLDENLTDISGQNLGNGSYIFTGTYSKRSASTSEGIFFCKTTGEQLDYIRLTKFIDLDNFLSYLSERRQAKIERKRKRKEEKGKEYTLNYLLEGHEIVSTDDGYILLGEAYYPTYRTETQTQTTTVNGVTTTTTTSVQRFDGYQYTHAMLAKFNLDGELLWDQTFEMWPSYKPYRVKKFITMEVQDRQAINLVFANRSKLVSKSFDLNGEVIREKESEKIETLFEGDRTRYSFTNLDYWYDNFFISYGKQKIKNKEDDKVKKKRLVYYISKVRFDQATF